MHSQYLGCASPTLPLNVHVVKFVCGKMVPTQRWFPPNPLNAGARVDFHEDSPVAVDATVDLFPCVRVHVVDEASGTEVNPTRCHLSDGTSALCIFRREGVETPTKLAWTASGPIALTYQKFGCKTHKNGLFVCKPSYRHLLDDGAQLEPFLLQLGQVSVLQLSAHTLLDTVRAFKL